jgi:hypothetical protein
MGTWGRQPVACASLPGRLRILRVSWFDRLTSIMGISAILAGIALLNRTVNSGWRGLIRS